jgi:hypothetical protein
VTDEHCGLHSRLPNNNRISGIMYKCSPGL